AGTGAGGTIASGGTTGTGTGGSKATGGRGGGGGAAGAGATAGGGRGGNSASGGTTGTGGAGATGGNAGGGTCGQQTGHGPLAASSTFYQDISCAPVDSESSTIMQALQASGWGSGLGIDVSFNVLNADSSGDSPDCDTSPVPLPAGGAIEGHSDYHCSDGEDCHLLVYQGSRLYELY